MGYTVLQDLVLKIDNTARDIDITNYNLKMSKLMIYVNALNSNVGLLQGAVATVSTEPPTGGDDGDTWITID